MRFKALDGWRGLAALLVAVYHLQFLNHFHELSFIRNSFLFVDFFFVLSGFVISYAYLDRLHSGLEIRQFIWRRIGRLWPLHVFVLLLFLGLEMTKLFIMSSGSDWSNANAPFTNEYSIPSFFSNFFLVQSLGLHDSFTWNYPSWSISVEFYTYLVFVLMTLLFKTNYLAKLALIIISLIIIYLFPHNFANATYNYGIFRCIAGFFAGVLTFNVYNYFKHKNFCIVYPTLIELSIVTLVFTFIALLANTKYSLLSPVLFALMIFIFANEKGIISRLLKTSFIQKLGKYSYSIYMMHAFILLLMSRSIFILEEKTNFKMYIPKDSPENPIDVPIYFIYNKYFMDLLTLIYLVILIYTASFTYRYIEKKGVALFKYLEHTHTITPKKLKLNE